MPNQSKGACIVTGSARGIGAATAFAAARRGYAVCVNYVDAQAAADRVAADIRNRGGAAISIRADVSSSADVATLFAAVDRELGVVTALVNNAGISGGRRPIVDMPPQDFARVVDINLRGTFLCSQAAIARMARSRGGAGGAIVNLSTAAVRTGGRQIAAYVAAKAGIEGLTRALSLELAEEGIRVNAIAPGIIATDQQPADEAWRARAAAGVPLGRLGSASEVADGIMWLLSAEAAYVTGAVLDITGGR
ncbi:MAG TPA: SDR family oxidoreductase [Stellaceae bacterium]|nr:SDR family oxidoreductase [Stellaceae bacterium]